MFRMLKLKPPNGWSSVAWELVIVTVGVLIALAVQQWAENRSWRAKARIASAAIQAELSLHYANAIEWRMVYPCLVDQIGSLQQRLGNSGATLDPAPVYDEAALASYVIRLPIKNYNDSAWRAALADGLTAHMSPELRNTLSNHYAQADNLGAMKELNSRDRERLFTLSRPLALNAGLRFELMQTLDEMRGRVDSMNHTLGQLLGHISKAGMIPHPSVTGNVLERSGTRQFCIRERFPLRSQEEAATPVDYYYSPGRASSAKAQ